MNTQNIKSLYINKLTLEDMELGVGTIIQTRGGKQVVRTKINAKNFPFDENRTLAQRLDAITEDLEKAEKLVVTINSTNDQSNKVLGVATALKESIKEIVDELEGIKLSIKLDKTQIIQNAAEAIRAINISIEMYERFKLLSLSFNDKIADMRKLESALTDIKDRVTYLADRAECALHTIRSLVKEVRGYMEEIREVMAMIPQAIEASKKACECAKKACECATLSKEILDIVTAKANEVQDNTDKVLQARKETYEYMHATKDLIEKHKQMMQNNLLLSNTTYMYVQTNETNSSILVMTGDITGAEKNGDEVSITYEDTISLSLNNENQVILSMG